MNMLDTWIIHVAGVLFRHLPFRLSSLQLARTLPPVWEVGGSVFAERGRNREINVSIIAMLHCWSFLGNRNMKQFSWCSCRTSRQQPIWWPQHIYIYVIITSIYLATMFIICPVHLMFDIPFDYPSCWLLDDMTLLDLQGPLFGPWLRSADDMISFFLNTAGPMCCWWRTLMMIQLLYRSSLDWFKGKSTGNHVFYHQI